MLTLKLFTNSFLLSLGEPHATSCFLYINERSEGRQVLYQSTFKNWMF